MAITNESDVYYDPYDFEIDADPHPVWKRLRDEAPLYYNERYDFFALSRFEDVEHALVDWESYRSGKGSILELIKADIEIPPGVILFEDPPVHDVHRGLLSRVFTPKKMNAIEPKVREFCARTLDPLSGCRRLRLHQRSRRTDADAHDRLSAGHPRERPGDDPRRSSTRGCASTRANLPTRPGSTPIRAPCSPSTSTGGSIIRPTT